jgi:membrane-associated phospholipid phosphatase
MIPSRPDRAARRLRYSLAALLLDARRLDDAVYEAITQTPTPSLDQSMRQLTRAADYSRLWLGCAAILSSTRGSSGRDAAVRGLASVAVSSVAANLVLKPLTRRRRPDSSRLLAARRTSVPDSSSFPSGHSASAFAFATGVGSVLPYEAVPIRGLAALVAYSRVHTGVHHPADAVAGALLGTTLAQLTCQALDRRG